MDGDCSAVGVAVVAATDPTVALALGVPAVTPDAFGPAERVLHAVSTTTPATAASQRIMRIYHL